MVVDPDRTPYDPLFIYPNRARHFLVTAGASGLSGFALVSALQSANPMAWLVFAIFGPMAGYLLLNFLPGAVYLEISRDALTICRLFRRRRHAWDDIQSIRTVNVGGLDVIVLDIEPPQRGGGSGWLRDLWRFYNYGVEDHLPDWCSFAGSTQELLFVLRQWQAGSPAHSSAARTRT